MERLKLGIGVYLDPYANGKRGVAIGSSCGYCHKVLAHIFGGKHSHQFDADHCIQFLSMNQHTHPTFTPSSLRTRHRIPFIDIQTSLVSYHPSKRRIPCCLLPSRLLRLSLLLQVRKTLKANTGQDEDEE